MEMNIKCYIKNVKQQSIWHELILLKQRIIWDRGSNGETKLKHLQKSWMLETTHYIELL